MSENVIPFPVPASAALRRASCRRLAQGYRYARPMDIADLRELIEARSMADDGNLRA